MTKNKLYCKVMDCYHNGDYPGAVEAYKAYIVKSKSDDPLVLSADFAHLLCLKGDYYEASKILSRIITDLETKEELHEAFVSACLAYAICLLNLDDYGMYCLYISKFMNLIRDSDAKTFEYLETVI